jgi:hypothetical protein
MIAAIRRPLSRALETTDDPKCAYGPGPDARRGPALAAEPPADAPTATATATGDPGVAAQIARLPGGLPASPSCPPRRARRGSGPPAPRGPHGLVEVAVGNHGYRSVYLESHMPLGENGMLSIAVGEQRGAMAATAGIRGLRRLRTAAGAPLGPSDAAADDRGRRRREPPR